MLEKLPDTPELEFAENNHIYKIDGIEIPSVSEIMKPLSADFYNGIREETIAFAANRGSGVHQAIENFLIFGIADIEPESQGYFDAFIKWYEKTQPTLVSTEKQIYHKIFRYGGTADFICYVGDCLTLVDFKTTATLNKMLVGVQLEAYKQAFATHGIKFERKIVLQLKKDGKYREETLPIDDTEAWGCFAALRTINIYKTKFGRKK